MAAGKTSKSILVSTAVRLTPFNLPQIKAITDHDDMDLYTLGEQKCALYAVIPNNDTTFNFLLKNPRSSLKNRKTERCVKRAYALFACLVLSMAVMIVPAFAADDPLQIVENLSDFIFSLIRAVGLILLGLSILQLGLSLESHAPSQRANGMLTVAGGIVITFIVNELENEQEKR